MKMSPVKILATKRMVRTVDIRSSTRETFFHVPGRESPDIYALINSYIIKQDEPERLSLKSKK